MDIVVTFLKLFAYGAYVLAPVLFSLAVIVALLGQVVARLESWPRFDALYWSFITATTVGYGDIRPVRHSSRVLSVLIAFVGLIFTGIVVAIAVQAAASALTMHGGFEAPDTRIERVEQD